MQNDPSRVPRFHHVKPKAAAQPTNPVGGSDGSAVNLRLLGFFGGLFARETDKQEEGKVAQKNPSSQNLMWVY